MPSLNCIKILGNVKFLSHGLKLPVNFRHPQGKPAAQHYEQAFKPTDKIAIPRLIPPWFLPAEIPNRYYQDTCDTIGGNFKDFHDRMLDAVKFAHDLWRLQARFQNLKVMAIAAIGTPGCLSGPELESFIKMAPSAVSMVGNMALHRDAVAKGVSVCFKRWQDNVTVPGLPWYPAFAAFPGPMAPPMPNVPTPLIACPSAMMSEIVSPMSMKTEMDNALSGAMKSKDPDKHYEALHDAIATVLALAFLMWLPQQQVMNVLGMGPIPTFAPPFVPVGPVVNGQNLPIPGHLLV